MYDIWTPQDGLFEFSCANYAWRIDPTKPHQGAALLARSDGRLLGRIFAIPALAMRSVVNLEPYIRSDDLIVRYPAMESQPVEVELIWRVHNALEWFTLGNKSAAPSKELSQSPIGVVELVVSFRTELLDAAPLDSIESMFPQAQLVRFDWPSGHRRDLGTHRFHAENVLAAESENDLFLTVVSPSDVRWLSGSIAEGGVRQLCRLEVSNLEKGVIRRLRLLFVAGPKSLASQLRHAPAKFAATELPLTA